jgi:hypothetical protein
MSRRQEDLEFKGKLELHSEILSHKNPKLKIWPMVEHVSHMFKS